MMEFFKLWPDMKKRLRVYENKDEVYALMKSLYQHPEDKDLRVKVRNRLISMGECQVAYIWVN